MSTIRWVVTRNGKRGHSCSLVSLGISIRKRNGRILAGHCLYEVEPRERAQEIPVKQPQQITKKISYFVFTVKILYFHFHNLCKYTWSSRQEEKPYVRYFWLKLVVETLPVHNKRLVLFKSKCTTQPPYLWKNVWQEEIQQQLYSTAIYAMFHSTQGQTFP